MYTIIAIICWSIFGIIIFLIIDIPARKRYNENKRKNEEIKKFLSRWQCPICDTTNYDEYCSKCKIKKLTKEENQKLNILMNNSLVFGNYVISYLEENKYKYAIDYLLAMFGAITNSIYIALINNFKEDNVSNIFRKRVIYQIKDQFKPMKGYPKGRIPEIRKKEALMEKIFISYFKKGYSTDEIIDNIINGIFSLTNNDENTSKYSIEYISIMPAVTMLFTGLNDDFKLLQKNNEHAHNNDEDYDDEEYDDEDE